MPRTQHRKVEVRGASVTHDGKNIIWQMIVHIVHHCIKVIVATATGFIGCVPLSHTGDLSKTGCTLKVAVSMVCVFAHALISTNQALTCMGPWHTQDQTLEVFSA